MALARRLLKWAFVILTVNAGSTSVRLGWWSSNGGAATERLLPDDGSPDELLARWLQGRGAPRAVAHRFAHGGPNLVHPRWIDATIERELERVTPFAPLETPIALDWLRACRKVLGSRVPEVAVFDTAFFTDLPAEAATYALPRAFGRLPGLRRYGSHGLAHQALWESWRALRPDVPDGGRVITLHLGGSCSAAAIERGRPRDCSFGFSRLEGLVGARSAGDVDPGLLLYLSREAGLAPTDLWRMLECDGGLRGLSGRSGELEELLDDTDPDARLALDVYCYRLRKYIGAYLAALGGVDAILWSGGVGQFAGPVRARVLSRLEWCGALLDPCANATDTGRAHRISVPSSRIELWVIPVDEGAILARTARELLARAERSSAAAYLH